MTKKSYGYRWILRLCLSFAFAMIITWLFYPTPDREDYRFITYYKFQDVLFFIADLTRYIILIDFVGRITHVIESFSRNKPYNWVSNGLGILFPVLLFLCGRDLFFHARDFISAAKAQTYSAEFMFNIIWDYDGGDLVAFFIFAVGLPFAVAYLPIIVLEKAQKIRESRLFRQVYKEGRGGSAQWATAPTYERFRANTSQNNKKILLGRSLIEDDPHPKIIGIDDDAHIITSGITGSGKSTTVLLPNLATYGGSCIVFDPKGDLAKRTYRCRSSKKWLEHVGVSGNTHHHLKNSRAYILDPFGETENLPLSNYNLLSEIDIESDRVRELLFAISDSCVISEGGENIHFEEMARYFIEGIIAHVLSKHPKENHHLPYVFDLIHGINPNIGVADPKRFNDLLFEMMENDAAGGLPQQVASKMQSMGDREKGSVLSTISRSVKWMGDPAMRKHLKEADFKFSSINEFFEVTKTNYRTFDENKFDKSTVYIVLPDGLIKEQMRWLRALISVSLTITKNRKANTHVPTLFIIDEFPRLGGEIKTVSDGFGIFRGYGIKLWCFVQTIEQIKKDYPDDWSTMLANSTLQIFGVNGYETAEWVSKMIGSAIVQRKEKRDGKKYIAHEAPHPLLDPNEVMSKLKKNQNRQVVKTVEGFPMRLERCAYKPLPDIGEHGFYEFSKGTFKGCYEDY